MYRFVSVIPPWVISSFKVLKTDHNVFEVVARRQAGGIVVGTLFFSYHVFTYHLKSGASTFRQKIMIVMVGAIRQGDSAPQAGP